ncbi:MAG: hypothetical protein Q8M94_22630 [Ignavibacteria bacterium]|nr:hypothetical protein [Ignavibacteria bacterium]
MSVERAAGYADYSDAGLNKLIPILWAAQAREKLNAQLFLPEITNANVIGASKQ